MRAGWSVIHHVRDLSGDNSRFRQLDSLGLKSCGYVWRLMWPVGWKLGGAVCWENCTEPLHVVSPPGAILGIFPIWHLHPESKHPKRATEQECVKFLWYSFINHMASILSYFVFVMAVTKSPPRFRRKEHRPPSLSGGHIEIQMW